MLLSVLVLALLGVNLFAYLAVGTQRVVDVLNPVLKHTVGITLAVTGETVDVSAEGAKQVVDGTARVVDAGLSKVQDLVRPSVAAASNAKSTRPPAPQRVADAAAFPNTNTNANNAAGNIVDDEAGSSLLGGRRAGYCYVGSEGTTRSCAPVRDTDQCMSGDIFPSFEQCINPRLR